MLGKVYSTPKIGLTDTLLAVILGNNHIFNDCIRSTRPTQISTHIYGTGTHHAIISEGTNDASPLYDIEPKTRGNSSSTTEVASSLQIKINSLRL
ncbi:hypothetical protein HALA3H3_810027 [Halomonas sp. A3H3]|nr:hypothetical protein HALA3H3_810027 [Halomonas sp. A3H3]